MVSLQQFLFFKWDTETDVLYPCLAGSSALNPTILQATIFQVPNSTAIETYQSGSPYLLTVLIASMGAFHFTKSE